MPSSGVHALLGIKVTSNLLVEAAESTRTLKLPRREAVLTSDSISEQPGRSQWYKKALTLTSSSSRFPAKQSILYASAEKLSRRKRVAVTPGGPGSGLAEGQKTLFGPEVVVTAYTSVEA